MQNHIGYINHILRATRNTELMSVYISVALRMFAFSLVGVFVPIYFLKELGFTINNVLLYYALWAVITLLITPFAAKLTVKTGFDKAMLASAPIAVLYLLLLHLMATHNIHYFWAAFTSALSMQLYWIGFHISFAQNSDGKKRGEEVSWWYSILMVVGLLGPIAGGLMITLVGFKALFLLAALIMIVSSAPLLFGKHKMRQDNFSMRSILKIRPRNFLVYTAYGMKELANSTIWPLFVFMLLGSEIAVGAIASAVALVGSVSSLVVGMLSDGSSSRLNILKNIGLLFDGISWPVRIALRTFYPILSVSVLAYSGFLLVDIPLYKKFYEGAKNHIENIVAREIALATGRVIITLFIMLLGFYAGFWLLGLSNLIYLLL